MSLDKEKILAAAQKFEDKEQYDKAIREYLKITESDVGDDRVLLRLATCYERANKTDEAAKTYIKLSVAYRDQGAYQKALAVLKQAQKYSPDDEIAMSMAELYSALGLPHEAVSQLERCLERCDIKENRRIYMRILQTMVRVDGENVQTRIRYANLLLEDGDQEGARRQYTLGLAQLLSKERYVDYIQTAREYLKFQPKDTDVLRELAQIFIRMERHSEAMMVLAGLDSSERTPEIRECLISCYMRLNRIYEAVRELKALAHQYEEEGGREDLIEDVWLRAEKLAPNDPEVMSRLGEEPPLLSDSALNVLMPVGGDNSYNGGGNANNELSNADRQCVALFSKTMDNVISCRRLSNR
ncbi:MAG: tetratricopeptide repeat protein [Lachnospiraceae bacterium]|nr:tetratricopeptide repeat protein [Lachnospiraceae bacterium]